MKQTKVVKTIAQTVISCRNAFNLYGIHTLYTRKQNWKYIGHNALSSIEYMMISNGLDIDCSF